MSIPNPVEEAELFYRATKPDPKTSSGWWSGGMCHSGRHPELVSGSGLDFIWSASSTGLGITPLLSG